MDSIIVTAAVILTVVALIEAVTLLLSVPGRPVPAYLAVLPVFSEDKDFAARLERLAQRPSGSFRVIIIDYSADTDQRRLIDSYLGSNPDAVLVSSSDAGEHFLSIMTAQSPDS